MFDGNFSNHINLTNFNKFFHKERIIHVDKIIIYSFLFIISSFSNICFLMALIEMKKRKNFQKTKTSNEYYKQWFSRIIVIPSTIPFVFWKIAIFQISNCHFSNIKFYYIRKVRLMVRYCLVLFDSSISSEKKTKF